MFLREHLLKLVPQVQCAQPIASILKWLQVIGAVAQIPLSLGQIQAKTQPQQKIILITRFRA